MKSSIRCSDRKPANYADLLVDGWLVVELKTAKALAHEHVAQVLGYLKSARLEHGLLINFGSSKFEMRKFAWSQDRSLPQEQAQVPFVRCLCVLCVLCGLIDEAFCLAPNRARQRPCFPSETGIYFACSQISLAAPLI
jgi:hypothetical protein